MNCCDPPSRFSTNLLSSWHSLRSFPFLFVQIHLWRVACIQLCGVGWFLRSWGSWGRITLTCTMIAIRVWYMVVEGGRTSIRQTSIMGQGWWRRWRDPMWSWLFLVRWLLCPLCTVSEVTTYHYRYPGVRNWDNWPWWFIPKVIVHPRWRTSDTVLPTSEQSRYEIRSCSLRFGRGGE